jgi:hypothetical protein
MQKLIQAAYCCIAVGVCLLSLSESPKCQECLATGDVNCSGGDFSLRDLVDFFDYLYFATGTLTCPHEADLIADCIVDWRDVQELSDWLLHTVEPPFSVTTCCDPILVYSDEPALPLGNSSVTIQENRAIADEIGATGDDGIRIYPNMDGHWQSWVGSSLENIRLTDDGAEANISFTGAGKLAMKSPFPDWRGVDTAVFLDHVGAVRVTVTGSQVKLAVDFLHGAIEEFRITSFVEGDVSGSNIVSGNAAEMIGDLLSGELAVTEFFLSLGDSTVLTTQLDRPIEFTIEGYSPQTAFTADALRFASVNVIQPTVGVGPFDITAANIDWLGVYLPTCCQGRVGDANGQGVYPDEVTLGDIMLLVDVKFISGDCNMLPCLREADVNRSGGPEPTCDDITLVDIMILVDFIFINSPGPMTLPECL